MTAEFPIWITIVMKQAL